MCLLLSVIYPFLFVWLSGNLRFCPWVVLSTSRTMTLWPADFRSLSFSLPPSSSSSSLSHLYGMLSSIPQFHFQRRDVYGAWEQYLGLEHTDHAPKRSHTTNQVFLANFLHHISLPNYTVENPGGKLLGK